MCWRKRYQRESKRKLCVCMYTKVPWQLLSVLYKVGQYSRVNFRNAQSLIFRLCPRKGCLGPWQHKWIYILYNLYLINSKWPLPILLFLFLYQKGNFILRGVFVNKPWCTLYSSIFCESPYKRIQETFTRLALSFSAIYKMREKLGWNFIISLQLESLFHPDPDFGSGAILRYNL
jgi:hypothetical protein